MVPADSCRISRVPHYSGAALACLQVFAYGAFTRCGRVFQLIRLTFRCRFVERSYNPGHAVTWPVWAPARSLATTCAIVGLLSFPPGNEMFQFPGFAHYLVVCRMLPCGGLPHSEIRASMSICLLARLIAACHVLLRLREPRHPSCALFSFPFIEKIAFFAPACLSLPSWRADGLSARPVEILQLNCLKELSVMIFALFARDT